MTTTIAILGAKGRLGRAVAKAFLDVGYDVRAVTRDGKLPAELAGATAVTADAMDRMSLLAGTRGADIIFNGLNPVYTDWSSVVPMAENVMQACAAHGALHLVAGTVYNFGSPMPAVITEETPQRPTTDKGRIRAETEQVFRRYAESGKVQTALLRAGDFFGGKGTGAWFDLVVASKVEKGVYTAPGKVDLVHEWAYLPDLASAFVALADNRSALRQYENLNFPSHPVTDLQMQAAVEKAVGRPLKLASMPWWVLRAGSPFVPMWKALATMSYLRFEPHQLQSERLAGLIGTIPRTPLDIAASDALSDLGIATVGSMPRAA